MAIRTQAPAWLLVDARDQVGELIGIDVAPGLRGDRRLVRGASAAE